MKKIIWVCGIIAGLISIGWALFGNNCLNSNVSYNTRLFWGYASMVLSFSLIYVGVKNYRDNQGGGTISFGKALKISLLITLVASTVYVGVWMIYYYCFLSVAIAKSFGLYDKPVKNILMAYLEIVPVGVIVSLIVSPILKRNKAVEAVNG